MRTFRTVWQDRKLDNQTAVHRGECIIRIMHGRVQVTCPQEPAFLVLAQELKGKHRARTGTWTFRREWLDTIKWHCAHMFPGKVTVM